MLKAATVAAAAAPADAAAKKALDDARAQLTKVKLDDARSYVERYPNDYAARFTLANLLYDAGDYQAAIGNYQQAQKSPRAGWLLRRSKVTRLPTTAEIGSRLRMASRTSGGKRMALRIVGRQDSRTGRTGTIRERPIACG